MEVKNEGNVTFLSFWQRPKQYSFVLIPGWLNKKLITSWLLRWPAKLIKGRLKKVGFKFYLQNNFL